MIDEDWMPGARLARAVPRASRAADVTAGRRPTHPTGPIVGVLALQGDVHDHLVVLDRIGARGRRVRRVRDLDGLDGIVLPGGESTTIGKLLRRFGMLEPLRDRLVAGLPAFGTCAGMILLSRELDQDFDQPLLGVLGIRTQRNAFGRQAQSFDTRLTVAGIDGGPMDASFIRAPRVTAVLDDDVEVLAAVDDSPVVVRQGALLACAFHPEVTGDDRLHAAFVADLGATRSVAGGP